MLKRLYWLFTTLWIAMIYAARPAVPDAGWPEEAAKLAFVPPVLLASLYLGGRYVLTGRWTRPR